MGIYEWSKKNTLLKGYAAGVIFTSVLGLGTAVYNATQLKPEEPQSVRMLRETRSSLSDNKLYLKNGSVRDLLRGSFRDSLVEHVLRLEQQEKHLEKVSAIADEEKYVGLLNEYKLGEYTQTKVIAGSVLSLTLFGFLMLYEQGKINRREARERAKQVPGGSD